MRDLIKHLLCFLILGIHTSGISIRRIFFFFILLFKLFFLFLFLEETPEQESRATADHRGSKSLSEQQGSKCTDQSF